MYRRGKRLGARRLLPWLVALVLVLALAACTPATTPTPAAPTTAAPAAPTAVAAAGAGTGAGTAAGTAAPGAATGVAPATPGAAGTGGGTPAGTAASGTPGSRTPTLTPTPVPTLTELQARLMLAKAYLDGKDYENAATLYAQIAQDTRGNAEALQGLQAALAGKADIQATQMAPIPTEAPTPVPTAVPAPTLMSATRSKVLDAFGFVVAALLLIALLYLFGALLRWVLTALRELWYMRILPLFGRPAVPPGFLIGEFVGSWTTDEELASRIVPIAITQKLTEWNQLVRDKQAPIELEREPTTGALAWLRVLWAWVLPPPRGYRVTGTFLKGPAGTQQMTVQRTHLGQHSVDRSRTFESTREPASEAYADMASEAGKWLIVPADIEADAAIALARGAAGETVSASATFDEVLNTLLPVRQQVDQGLVDFPEARRRMTLAEGLINRLPADSALRAELTRVFAGLRRAVPGG